MECEPARCLVLQHDLGPAERKAVHEAITHVEGCSACREAVADYDRFRDLLREPESEAEPIGGWEAFEQRLATPAPARHASRRFVPLALAACLAMAFTGWGLYFWNHGLMRQGPLVASVQPIVARPSEQEIVERARLFDEVSEVFEHRAQWVLVADGGSDMGLGTQPSSNGQNLLLVRISISRDGSPFSTADLVVVPGQLARTNVSAAQGLQLQYEVATSQADPTHLRISADMVQSSSTRSRLGGIASDLSIRMGQIASIGQVVTGNGTYEFNIGLYRAGDSDGRRS